MGQPAQLADDLARVLRERRSIDLFEPTPVDRQVVIDAIEVARWAPNHRLTQPWRFYLLGPLTVERLIDVAANYELAVKGDRAAQARRARLSAVPGFFVLTSERSDDALLERENYAACCCAAQNLMLFLWAKGIGVKWTTGAVTRQPEFFDALGIDSSREELVGLFWFGVPRVIPQQQRHDVAAIVTACP